RLCRLRAERAEAGSASGERGEHAVRLVERLLRADVEPDARHAPGVERGSRVEPLDEAARLIRIVPLVQISADERQRLARVEVQRDPGERRSRMPRLLLEEDDPPVAVDVDRVVLPDRLEVADVVDGEDRRLQLAGRVAEAAEGLAEQVVAGD